MARSLRNAGLDPVTHYEAIARNLGLYEFPWDTMQALGFALFRTYAIPSVGRLLDQTGEFVGATQKRHDDTALLLEQPGVHGLASPEGRSAIRRINQMHHLYDITNDDFRYVLSTFVVVPKRWIDDYGWRTLTPTEIEASVRYYQELGKRMGIKDIPATFDAFAQLMDEYEAANFGFDEGGRRVADATLDLLATFYPLTPHRFTKLFARAVMDEPLLDAFHYDSPPKWFVWLVRGGLKARARLVAKLPPRRKPKYVSSFRRIRSYPHGFDVSRLGSRAVADVVLHKSA